MAGKITVFGGFVVDLASRADHLPVPAESVLGSSFSMGPGGKGSNQGVAAHLAGADVTMVTKVGNDLFGKVALDFYRQIHMPSDFVFVDEQKETGTAIIMVDEKTAQNQILIVPGANANITDTDLELIEPVIAGSDILLVQLEVNLEANWKCIDIAHKNGVQVVLNPAPAQAVPDEILAKVDILTPNEVEASALSGIKVVTPEDAKNAAEILHSKGIDNIIITLGEQGAFVKSPNKAAMIERKKVKAKDTTGAGDAFNGGLVAALAEGSALFEAAEFANVVGALSVTKVGAARAMPTRAEIDAFISYLKTAE